MQPARLAPIASGWWLLAPAVVGSLLLGAAPLAAGDPFRTTLPLIPWVAVGLVAIHRWAAANGAHRRIAAGGGELIAAGLLVLCILGRAHLGLGSSAAVDALLATGLVLVLAHSITGLVPSLLPCLKREPPWRPPWPFFVLPLLVYLALLPWSSARRAPDGDEPYYLLIAHSLAYDFDTDLTNNYAAGDSLRFLPRELEPEWADPVGPGGERYSRHNMLFPLLLAPAYRLAGRWGAMAVVALLAAATAWMSLRVARRYWPDHPRGALTAWGLLAFTPPLLVYSQQVWVEVPAALLLLLAIDSIAGLQMESEGRWRWLGIALPLALLPLLKLRFLLLAIPVLALTGWRVLRSRPARAGRALIALAILLIAVAAGMLLYNQLLFDNPWKDHTFDQLRRLQKRPPFDYVRGAMGLLFDCAFGLVAMAPVWLLIFPAAVVLWRRRAPLLRDLLVCSLPYLAVVSPRMEWYGAWSPPFRLGMALLPLLAIGLVPLLGGRGRGGSRALVAGLAALTVALALLWVTVPSWTFNLADGTSHLLGYLNERLGADAGRLFPSFVRERGATWWWPAASVALALGCWRMPLRRGAARAWGVILLLAAGAALPLAARHLPTRTIEFEDRQVRKSGGRLYPDPWVPARPRYRGGWIVETGTRLQAPVVSGGSTVTVELDLQPLSAAAESFLEIWIAQRTVARWPLRPARSWQTMAVRVADWPRGAALEIRVTGEAAQRAARVVLDRARLRWR